MSEPLEVSARMRQAPPRGVGPTRLSGAALARPALAALSLALLWPLSAQSEQRSELGVFGGMHLFSEDNELGMADNLQTRSFASSVMFGLRGGLGLSPAWSLEAEIGWVPTSLRDAGGDATVWAARGHFVFDIVKPGAAEIFAVGGAGVLISSLAEGTAAMNDTDAMVHAGIGMRWRFTPQWVARADLRLLLPPAIGGEGVTTDFEGLLGVSYRFGARAEDKNRDSDHDGVLDVMDLCPFEPETRNGVRDEDGCPEGVGDGASGLRTGPRPTAGNQPTHSALPPLRPTGDKDGDGIEDDDDLCPDVAEDKDGFEDADGCPDTDNDTDGLADDKDKCPLVAETPNGYQDEDGCPDDVPVKVKRFTGRIEGIFFKTGSATILKKSFRVLDAALKVLKEFPETRLDIEGHTDNLGKPDFNLELSRQRAESVKAYLVGKGLDAARLTARGYGQQRPLQDNGTEQGRAANRRVEFKLVSALTGGDSEAEPDAKADTKAVVK